MALVLEVLPAEILGTPRIVPARLPEPINEIRKRRVAIVCEGRPELRPAQSVYAHVLHKGPIQHGTAFKRATPLPAQVFVFNMIDVVHQSFNGLDSAGVDFF